MRNLMIALSLIGIMNACGKKQNELKTVEVKHVGALRQIMHEGKYEGRILLKDLPQEHLFGLGAMKELQGEILIMDEKPLLATVENKQPMLRQSEAAEATLLVYAQVPAWDTIQVVQSGTISDLIAKELATRNLSEPSPFILLGKAEKVHYHIINFDVAKGDFSKHREGAFQEVLTNSNVHVLGFYATQAKGIYTHHDSHVHMHFKTSEGDKSGHVDEVSFGKESVQLLLPKL